MTAALETPSDPSDLFGQLSDDPRAAKIAQVLKAMNAERTRGETEQQKEHARVLREFKSILNEVRRENARLREINGGLLAHSELLAGAIGACPECWGENAACGFCGGDGAPGAFMPQQQSFEEFVRPVLAAMRASMVKKPKPKPVQPPKRAARAPKSAEEKK